MDIRLHRPGWAIAPEGTQSEDLSSVQKAFRREEKDSLTGAARQKYANDRAAHRNRILGGWITYEKAQSDKAVGKRPALEEGTAVSTLLTDVTLPLAELAASHFKQAVDVLENTVNLSPEDLRATIDAMVKSCPVWEPKQAEFNREVMRAFTLAWERSYTLLDEFKESYQPFAFAVGRDGRFYKGGRDVTEARTACLQENEDLLADIRTAFGCAQSLLENYAYAWMHDQSVESQVAATRALHMLTVLNGHVRRDLHDYETAAAGMQQVCGYLEKLEKSPVQKISCKATERLHDAKGHLQNALSAQGKHEEATKVGTQVSAYWNRIQEKQAAGTWSLPQYPQPLTPDKSKNL
jgi:hypothetical protein